MAERNLRIRRGVVREQVTKLRTRLTDLKTKSDQPQTLSHARRMARKLEELNAEFKHHHFALLEVIEDDTAIEREQSALDELEDDVAELFVEIEELTMACAPVADPSIHGRRIISRRLAHLQRNISHASSAIEDESVELHLLKQYKEQLSDYKGELIGIRNELISLDIDESDDLSRTQDRLEKNVFQASLTIRKLLERATDTDVGSSSKLPKLEVPRFNGDILHWKSFWEQFSVSVDCRSNLSDVEKLVYLRQSLKDSVAKNVIEGLSKSGDCYPEAVKCLKDRFDRPRIVHQAHVRAILEVPALREGSGKELRRLHDVLQQHLRALKVMGHEPSSTFITSAIELKLDAVTMFEWQKHSQDYVDVPPHDHLMEFIDLRARASETSPLDKKASHIPFGKKVPLVTKHATSYTVNNNSQKPVDVCVVCKSDKHPLYLCTKFKSFSHEHKMSVLKSNNLCINCLKPGHYVRQCKSIYHCKICQEPHHSLLHVENNNVSENTTVPNQNSTGNVTSHTATELKSNVLLMTCKLLIEAPNGSMIEARGLIDSASSVSFVSERIVQTLRLSRSSCNTQLSGIAGLTHQSSIQSVATFNVCSTLRTSDKINVSAIVLPRITRDLPVSPVPFNSQWDHLSDISLADPTFGLPGRIDILLGADIFSHILLQGRRFGPPGTPTAFETKFGWVLVGRAAPMTTVHNVITCHVIDCDHLLKSFWEVEKPEFSCNKPSSVEERLVIQHYQKNHFRAESGMFVVPLPKRNTSVKLGESRSKALRRFLSFERSLSANNQKKEVNQVMKEYFELGHAEVVPHVDLNKPPHQVFYLPMHVVRKDSSTTTKLRIVFDASAKSSTGISLNDTLLVGPTVHPPLVDVLLRFRGHRIALTTDVSKMYRAVGLTDLDKDFHRFLWREEGTNVLTDYRMTRVTFGVSASSFAAIMSIKQNVTELANEFPLAYKAVCESFYVDDGLTGAESVEEVIELQKQLQTSFSKGGFLLRKWNSSSPKVLEHLPAELKVSHPSCSLPSPDQYTKTLGIEWNSVLDHFRLTVADFPKIDVLTKRALVSDIAKTFDVLGWFAPATITVKILLQRVWEEGVDWDDPVPASLHDIWARWRSELGSLSMKHIARCYYPKECQITSTEVHGFSDASEVAYAAVLYFRMIDTQGKVHVSIITSKTKVAPLKRLTIPRLELCGAHLLSQLLFHVKEIFCIPLGKTFAWTDSTVVLDWLRGNPRRFKTFVGNRVSEIIDSIPPECWRHVDGLDNPADCASRGLFPSELLEHHLWWSGPKWLQSTPNNWPNTKYTKLLPSVTDELRVCLASSIHDNASPIFPLDRYSSFSKVKHVTGWIKRFIFNCRISKEQDKCRNKESFLSAEELRQAENYWLIQYQREHFANVILQLNSKQILDRSSGLITLDPFVDHSGLLRVGGRQGALQKPYDTIHPIILVGKHLLTKLIVRAEHVRLLHAGPTLVHASLSRKFFIIGGRRSIRSVTRNCITCRKISARPQPQKMGNLPIERIMSDHTFSTVGVDYAGPFYTKYGYVRKPTVVKSYVCVFVSLTIKAVHLELVSDLTTDAFLSCLRRFVSRRGKPSMIMSDHGTNFVGAARELRELYEFLQERKTQKRISEFCSYRNIEWKFIPERAPHFGGLWEAAVKAMKYHLKRVVGETKLTFEEFSTLLSEVEACMNSRPITPLSSTEDAIEVLTPGHFLIGRPLEAIPDPPVISKPISQLTRWHLVQALINHFWKRWSTEYLSSMRKITKWHNPSRNIQVGDVVIVHEDNLVPTRWPLAKVIETHPGKDNYVRAVTIKTINGIYKRPVTKLALLVQSDNNNVI